jgi:hypothetical protein
LLVLDVAGDASARADVAVIPALGVDRIDAEELEGSVVELVLDGVDHATVFELEEATARGGKDDHRNAGVAEGEELHLAAERRREPFLIFAFQALALC